MTPLPKVRFTNHGHTRTNQRLVPVMGKSAHGFLKKTVARALVNDMVFDAAPGWADYRYSLGERAKELGWVVSHVNEHDPIAILINRKKRSIVTILTLRACEH